VRLDHVRADFLQATSRQFARVGIVLDE